jgi:hypothetical protein
MALLDSVNAALAAIPPSTDPATQSALNAIQATIDTNDAAIVADVLKNTPVTPTPAAAAKYRAAHPKSKAHAKHDAAPKK